MNRQRSAGRGLIGRVSKFFSEEKDKTYNNEEFDPGSG